MDVAIVELVRFRLAAGADPEAFAESARALDALVQTWPGFIRRTLSGGKDGVYTDHIVWRDMASASAAAKALPAAPEAAPFMAAIEMASVEMSHSPVVNGDA
jgi:heme-degrading monooxygenase HmoA